MLEINNQPVVRESPDDYSRKWCCTYKEWLGEFRIIWQRRKPGIGKYKVEITVYNPQHHKITTFQETCTSRFTAVSEFESYVDVYLAHLAKRKPNDSLTQPQQLEPVRESLEVPPPSDFPLNAVREYTPKGTARGTNKYFCYSYRQGRGVKHIHIPGGNVTKPEAQANAESVKKAIQAGKTPGEIEELIRAM